jgi:hypothetical protein
MDASGKHNMAHPDSLAWTLGQELHVMSWLLDRRGP